MSTFRDKRTGSMGVASACAPRQLVAVGFRISLFTAKPTQTSDFWALKSCENTSQMLLCSLVCQTCAA